MNTQPEFELSKSGQYQELAQQVISILQGIRFGSIEIVVHDGRVVQIDKHEKFRIKNAVQGY